MSGFTFTPNTPVSGAYSINSPGTLVVNKISCRELITDSINSVNVSASSMSTESILSTEGNFANVVADHILSNTALITSVIETAVARITNAIISPTIDNINDSITALELIAGTGDGAEELDNVKSNVAILQGLSDGNFTNIQGIQSGISVTDSNVTIGGNLQVDGVSNALAMSTFKIVTEDVVVVDREYIHEYV